MRKEQNQDLGQREPFLRELLTATKDAAVVEGTDGHMLAVNPAFLELVGWTDPYRGQPLDELLTAWKSRVAHPQVLEDYFRACRTGTYPGSPFRLEPSPGQVLEARFLSTGAIVGTPCRIWFFRDCRVTSLAWVSHEVKNPLNAVDGFVEQLWDGLSQAPSIERTKALVEGLRLSTRQLQSILVDLFNLANQTSSVVQTHPGWVPLGPLLADIETLYRDRFHRQGLEFLVESEDLSGTELWIDRGRLTQILDNLLCNALNFTPRGWVALRVNSLDGTWNFAVEDSGEGISPERQKMLLRAGGAGLGLAICQSLAQSMGGSLSLESQVGQGSRFTVAFPGLITQSSQGLRETLGAGKSGPTILVADDEKMIHLLVQGFLKGTNATVLEAGDGLEAVDLWTAHRPDIILMDLRMPRLSGLDAARRIHSIDPQSTTKLLVMSGVKPSAGELVGGRPLWAGYLEKPFTKQALLRFLSRYVTLTGDTEPTPVA